MIPHIKQILKANAVKAYYHGKSVKYLCVKYHVKKSAVYQWIKDSKDEIKISKFETSIQNKQYIISLVLNGSPVKDVCSKYNINQSTLYYWISHNKSNDSNIPIIARKQKLKDINRLEESIEILKSISIIINMNILEKVKLIRSLSANHSLSLLFDLLNMNRSTYYNYSKINISSHMKRDMLLKQLIKETYLRHKKRIGALKIKQDLFLQGHYVSVKKIYQLMQELEIRKVTPKKNQYIKLSKRGNILMPNHLKQEFNQKAPNLVWVSDITEIKIKQKPVYLCVIMDLFSRKIIAHQVSRKNNTRLTTITLNQAIINQKNKPNMFHSDRGVQYTSFIFKNLLQKLDITQSFSAPGYPYDNAAMESFFAAYKRETVKKMIPFRIIQDYIKMVNEYIIYYNNFRFHKSLNLVTPNEKENIYYSSNICPD